MNDEALSSSLSPRQVRDLVRQHRLEVSPNSPLQAALHGPDEGEPASAALLGDADLHGLLLRAAAPDHQVRVLVAGPAGTHTMLLYGHGSAPEELVACQPTAGKVPSRDQGGSTTAPTNLLEIGGGWTPRRIAMVTGFALDPVPPIADELPSLNLSPGSLLATMAAVDAFREVSLRSLLDRQPSPSPSITSDLILRQAEMGTETLDPRWLTSLLRLAAPIGVAPEIEELTAGFNAILAEGLLEVREDGTIVAMGPLRLLVNEWTLPLPAVATEVTAVDAEGRLLRFEHQLALRGVTQAWRVCHEDLLREPRVTVRAVDAPSLLEPLEELVTPRPLPAPTTATAERPAPTPERPAATPEQSASRPEQPAATPDPPAATPEQPAATPEQPAARPGQQAQRPMVATPEAPGTRRAPRFCSSCAAPLKPEAPFCSNCGTPVKRSPENP